MYRHRRKCLIGTTHGPRLGIHNSYLPAIVSRQHNSLVEEAAAVEEATVEAATVEQGASWGADWGTSSYFWLRQRHPKMAR